MKTKLNGLLTLLLAFVVQVSFAQEKTYSGVVADESGPLPGVSVVIVGTSKGSETDFEGLYRIDAKPGDQLQFSYIGMKSVTITLGDDTSVDVSMESENLLEEVVVTGLGIKREKQALGYAVSNVDQAQLEQRTEGDVGRVLSGKASGVQITNQSGMSGSGTSILIRGMNSFSGNNQPLFIVDGVPFASNTNAQGDFVDGNNGSSRFLDLDPNNIESVSVLKGLAAANLYGTQGANGVILITTKSGSSKGVKKKNEISISAGYYWNEIASMPDYQDEYGGGFDQAFGWFFSNWGPSFAKDGPAGWGSSSAFDENGTLPHPYSTAASSTGIPQAFPEYADARYDWKPYNSVGNFFRTGTIKNVSVNMRGASDDGNVNYNFSYGNLDEEGFTPGNSLGRDAISVGGRAKLSNKFTVASTLNYTYTDFVTPPVAAGYGSNVSGDNASIFGNLFYTPRSVDMIGLPYQNPVTGESVYYRQNNSIQHPLWTVNNAANEQDTYRTFGSVNVSYDISDNLLLSYKYGIDVYNENNTNYSNKGGKTGSISNQLGVYQTWTNTNKIEDHNLNINGNFDLGDQFGVTFTTGVTSRNDRYDRQGVSSTGQQVFGVLRHFNFATQDEIQYSEERNILGAYGQAEVDFNNFLYVTLSGRNDWVSNLSKENNSIFYPSASVSWVPTKMIGALKESNTFNFLKVRAGYGTSASFPLGYPIATTLSLDTQYFQDDAGVDVVTNSTALTLGNPNLKPQTIGELELGIEGRMFDNRLSMDLSVYRRVTNDLIVTRPLDPSTGYTNTETNVGQIENNGFEIDLALDVFRNPSGFNWNTAINMAKSEAITKDLGLDTDIVVYAGFTNLGNAAIVGESLGTIIGTSIARDENGNKMVNGAGDYVVQNGNNIIGDANPDFNFNWSNGFSYKGLSVNALMTWVQGGDILSYTTATLLGRGVVAEEGVNREASFILPGVNPAGEPNTTQINNSDYYFGNVLYGPDEMLIYDATRFRLQEVSVAYSLPQSILENSPFGTVSFTVSGNNLWFYAPNIPGNTNFDPNVAGLGVGNGRGFDYLNGPSSKRYGFSVKATF
ncbi:SusC/RagA family TonB-linked outer membrane protein [Flavobacteriaceae bacterium]|nr:SusC/RagA family TonB-linked outer membrane protein [Flavobacteriaceae bacterium]